ncbi:MAG: hypothetical protein KIT16_11610 [Rhodospirillaceae bacterium]|nr:hypothetical protein [Rhodospirillaceae bacterium]
MRGAERGARAATRSLRCDPPAPLVVWNVVAGAILALVFIVLLAPPMARHAGLALALSTALAAIAIGARTYAWRRSFIAVDGRTGLLRLQRLGWWGLAVQRRQIAVAEIAAVVLARRTVSALPLRMIALRLAGGGHVLVSTFGSSFGLLDEHAARIAAAIGCRLETVDTVLL